MSSLAAPPTGRTLDSPAAAFTSVLSAAAGLAAAKLERKLSGWVDKLEDVAGGGGRSGEPAALADAGLDGVADSGGAAQGAAAKGAKAALHGKNPVWGAVTGAWHSGPPAVRAAIVTAAVSAVLLLLLSPVLLLVFLLSLLVIAAVRRAGSATT